MMGDKLHPKAWLLGPKAENQDVFEKFLLDALRDYCYWRRNFHPEDKAYVTAADRQAEGFQNYHEVLHDHLFDMLSRLKKKAPKIEAALVDLKLRDRRLGGIEFLKHILPKPYFRGAVIFTDFDDDAIRREAKHLGDAFPHKTLRLRRKPTRLMGRSQAQFNRVMEDLWEILHSAGQGVRV